MADKRGMMVRRKFLWLHRAAYRATIDNAMRSAIITDGLGNITAKY